MVYLLHLSIPLEPTGNRHYIGFAASPRSLKQRLAMHHAGKGARFTQVAVERGIELELARVWEGTRQFERNLKRQKNAPRFCPICKCFNL